MGFFVLFRTAKIEFEYDDPLSCSACSANKKNTKQENMLI